MSAITETELEKLLIDLEEDPNNLDLLNLIAIGYFENYNMNEDKDDYDYFERAYLTKKTIKSTHNFAWFLYFEWSEIEWRWNEDRAINRALEIQKECIELAPKSYYPYLQYGYMLLDQKEYKKAIYFLEKSNQIEKTREAIHNLGCCHFFLGNYEEASIYFLESSNYNDIEHLSYYCFAITEFKRNNLNTVKSIADKLYESIDYEFFDRINGYDISFLYFLLKDFEKATACILKQGINGISIGDSDEEGYSVYLTNKEIWKNSLLESIKEKENWIKDIETGEDDDEYENEDEKNQQIKELYSEIESLRIMLENGLEEPLPKFENYLSVEYCGCLLFDCKRHENRKDD